MPEVHKTVFISYRRKPAAFIARAIFQDLQKHGYDVFMDVESIDAGDFKRIIENQIKARAHFLVVLTAGTIGKFDNPTDMMRHEIEYAMEHERNIVPLLINDFKFSKMTFKYLTGKLADLPKQNGAFIRHELFDAYMENLRDRFLSKPVDVVVSSTPAGDEAAVEKTLADVAAEPVPTQEELSAEVYFARGYEKQEAGDIESAIADYTQAIAISPEFANAYHNRGVAYQVSGDLHSAITDFDMAIRLSPKLVEPYVSRGHAYYLNGDLGSAVTNYAEAIHIDPQYAEAYNGKGVARSARNPKDAIADFDEAIRINPNEADFYSNRAEALFSLDKFEEALIDFQRANNLKPAFQMTLSGLAITQFMLKNSIESKRLWHGLLKQDERYQDADWVGEEFNWQPELVEAARKLIATL